MTPPLDTGSDAGLTDGGESERTPTVCLVMIVRDEAPILRRCLASVRPHITAWIVCDTGSVDESPAIVEAELADLPGALHHRPWRSFGENRTEAVAFARSWADYLLILDADMTLNVFRPFRHLLCADAYYIRYEGRLEYYQPMLLSARHAWHYTGATHEYVSAATAKPPVHLSEISLTHHCDGRSRADKLRRDIHLLEAAIQADPEDSRATFYLALSHQAAGNLDRAQELFERRVQMAGWDEEVWFSLYQTARLTEQRRAHSEAIVAAYRRAFDYRPSRIEPLPALVRQLRNRGETAAAYELARCGLNQSPPADLLFIERDARDWHLPFEYAESCWATGRYDQALYALNRLLDEATLPSGVLQATVRLQARCLSMLFAPAPTPAPVSRITVLMPFYNAGPFLERAVGSLLAQDDENFRVIACDDASTDGCASAIPTADERFTLRVNSRNLGGGQNFHTMLTEDCAADDIVVHLDGDDWFCANDALSYIRRFYETHDCWVMYGQFQTSRGGYGSSRAFPDAEAFRRKRQRFVTSHVRTFRAGLYHRLADQDPDYACMKGDDGEWFRQAMDMAIMYPILELAGYERVRFNDRILYTYNLDNPLSLFRADPERERAAAQCIRNKPTFHRIESYFK